jgi:Rieske [2Fe-2S] domain
LTTFLGETPIIVTRAEDGEIHAMVNRCAHRGNLVCLKRRGHADNLTCVYHAWRYDLEGNLDSVAFRRGIAGKGGMPASFRLEEHGLKKLRVDRFGELVFGTLSPGAPPLSNYIGNLIGSRIHRVMHGKPKILGTTFKPVANRAAGIGSGQHGHHGGDPQLGQPVRMCGVVGRKIDREAGLDGCGDQAPVLDSDRVVAEGRACG